MPPWGTFGDRMSGVVALVVVLALVGCGEVSWTKPGATHEEFNRDADECDRQAKQFYFGKPALRSNLFTHCLTVRGWRRE